MTVASTVIGIVASQLLAQTDPTLAPESLPDPPELLTVVSYNLNNYAEGPDAERWKSTASRAAVVQVLAELAPDIAVLMEVGGTHAAAEIQQALARHNLHYPFVSVVEASDQNRRIMILARWKPHEIRHDTTTTYRLQNRNVPIRRGFAYCIFEWSNNYRLHLVGAHLKSKVYDPLGQTDRRRYEARHLRYLVDDILKKEPAANLLVVGDFNDAQNSSPLNTLFARRRNRDTQLYDLRPLDSFGMAWTHFWDDTDEYSRIDYALASFELLPEINFKHLIIPQGHSSTSASDHRPLRISLHPVDNEMHNDILKNFDRNIRKHHPQ